MIYTREIAFFNCIFVRGSLYLKFVVKSYICLTKHLEVTNFINILSLVHLIKTTGNVTIYVFWIAYFNRFSFILSMVLTVFFSP